MVKKSNIVVTVTPQPLMRRIVVSSEIKKAHLKGDTLKVDYSENYNDNTHAKFSKDDDQIVHQDLRDAFSKLVNHLVLICDQKESKDAMALLKAKDYADSFEQYIVTGFTIGGSEDSEGVTLIGQKDLTTGVLNLISPFQKYQDDNYKFTRELELAIESCLFEVNEYLNGKAAIKQTSLEFGEQTQPALQDM